MGFGGGGEGRNVEVGLAGRRIGIRGTSRRDWRGSLRLGGRGGRSCGFWGAGQSWIFGGGGCVCVFGGAHDTTREFGVPRTQREATNRGGAVAGVCPRWDNGRFRDGVEGFGGAPPRTPPLRYLTGVDALVAHPGAKHVGSDALGVGPAADGGGDDVHVGADQVPGDGHCGGEGEAWGRGLGGSGTPPGAAGMLWALLIGYS